MPELEPTTTPLIGVGYRAPLAEWILTQPPELGMLEITAEHFFDGGHDRLRELSAMYALSVHGLGLSLGTPGPLDDATLRQFAEVVKIANAGWISEHVAFTRSDEVDLGHLNPVVPSEETLAVFVDHARQLSDVCGKPLLLENITSYLRLSGEFSEPEFLNRLCDEAGCWLLLDVTNLFINRRNHRFNPFDWLRELDLQNVRQLHVVGYTVEDGVWHDRHAAAIQDDLLELVALVVRSAPVEAIIVERDGRFPPTDELGAELRRLRECVDWARTGGLQTFTHQG